MALVGDITKLIEAGRKSVDDIFDAFAYGAEDD
jgi:hypothetical protein